MDYYFCPFCHLYPVEYVFDLNIFPFLHVCSTCVLRKNIYYKNMFRELHQTSNREHDKGSSGGKYAGCKSSTDNIPGVRKHKIVIDKPGINENFIFSSCRRNQTEQYFEYAFATGPEITYVPSNDKISKSDPEEISEVQTSSRKENSNDILIPDKNHNLNNITYYSNSNTSTKYSDLNINSSILKLFKHETEKETKTENFKKNIDKIAYTIKILMIVHMTSIQMYPYHRHRM